MNEPAFFIFGGQRSGTSLFSTLLTQHPEVNVIIDSCIMNQFVKWCHLTVSMQRGQKPLDAPGTDEAFLKYQEKPSEQDVKRFVALMIRHWELSSAHFEFGKDADFTLRYIDAIDVAQLITETRAGRISNWKDVLDFIFTTLASFGKEGRSTYFGEKTPNNGFCVDFIEKIYPDAKLLCLVRNPFCNIGSLYRRYAPASSLEEIVKVYLDYYNFSVQDSSRLGFVVFDNVLNKTSQVMNDVFGFLGIPPVNIGTGFSAQTVPLYVGDHIDSARHFKSAELLNDAQKEYVRQKCRPIFERFFPNEL